MKTENELTPVGEPKELTEGLAKDAASLVVDAQAPAASPDDAGAEDGPDASALETDPDLIIVSGMSGAGRTEAMHTFEDYGYFCIDNLPPRLLLSLVSLSTTNDPNAAHRKLAVVCDTRKENFYAELREELDHVVEAGLTYRIIFLDARDSVIINRYKASRRIHPMCKGNRRTIAQGIKAEREHLAVLRQYANVIVDTSDRKASELRQYLRSLFSGSMMAEGMKVNVYSFGFKHGAPVDADIVIDVRFLTNPYYINELRTKTGMDDAVFNFVMENPVTQEFLTSWKSLLKVVMPGYEKEGKQQLSIAIGCTGGQHRSVSIARVTGEFLEELGYDVHTSHRDLALAETREGEK